MSKRTEVTNALLRIVEEAVPSVPWSVNITGSNVSKNIEGTVSCDRVLFDQQARDLIIATATFSVYVVDMGASAQIEDIGDTLFSALNNSDLDGTCLRCDVNSIIYGAPRGNSKAMAMLIEVVAEYYV